MWHGGYSLCHLKITAGGGPRPKSTNNFISSTPLRKSGENKAEREKQALGFLPHSRNTLAGNFAASRTLCNDSGSSSALISAIVVHLCFSLSRIFFKKQCHRCCKLHLPQCTLCSSLVTGTLKPDTLHWRLLFTLALAPGLTVTPLHFHINST